MDDPLAHISAIFFAHFQVPEPHKERFLYIEDESDYQIEVVVQHFTMLMRVDPEGG